ncbi:hypothetical protein Tco_0863345 [Tanacetum coccineum]
MLELKLETEEESSMALELIKFVRHQLEEFEDSNDDDTVTSTHEDEERWMVYQLTKFYVQRVDMVLNPPWNLPFLGAKGLTSPEQTATGVNTPGSDENRLKLYVLMYNIVKVADTRVKD